MGKEREQCFVGLTDRRGGVLEPILKIRKYQHQKKGKPTSTTPIKVGFREKKTIVGV